MDMHVLYVPKSKKACSFFFDVFVIKYKFMSVFNSSVYINCRIFTTVILQLF